MKAAFGLVLLMLASPTFAIDLLEETDWGSTIFEQSVTAGAEFGGSNIRDAPWDVNASYAYSHMVTPNPGSDPIVDDSDDWSGGLGWTGDQGLSVVVNLNYDITPAESLVARGGTATLSYKWKYEGQPKDEDAYSPSLTFKVDLGTSNYLETFTGMEPRKKKGAAPRPVSGTEEIRQTTIQPALTWRPHEDWKIDAGIEADIYNRDVAQFENNLDSNAAVNLGASGFSSTIGGLPRVTYNFSVAWYFSDDWRVVASEAWAVLAADGTNSTTTKLTLDYSFAKIWRVTAGAEYLFSETLTDTAGIVGLRVDI